MSWTPNSNDVVYQDSFWGLVMAHQGTFIESGMTASVTGSNNTVSIASGVYFINGTRYTYSGGSIDLASVVPGTANQSRFVVIHVNTSGTLAGLAGTSVDTSSNDDSLRVTSLAGLTANCLLIRVRLENGSNISSSELFDSCRIVKGQERIAPEFSRIRLVDTTDASLTSTDHAFQIGASNSANLRLDNNEIMAISNGAVANLYINGHGGEVAFGSSTYRMTYDGSNGSLDLNGSLTSTSTITGQFVSNATVDFNHPIDLDSNSASDFNGTRTGSSGYILRISNSASDGNDAEILRLQFPNDPDIGSDFGEDKFFINFFDSSGTVGNISGEVNYNNFTGSHEGLVISPQTPLENWRKGVILSSTGDVPSTATFSRALVNVDISTSAKDKTIMGVFNYKGKQKHETHELNNHQKVENIFYYEDSNGDLVECQKDHYSGFGYDEELVHYNAVGEGMILVTNADGDINNGDYITTGTYNGIGVLQDDDLQHSYTVAKCTEQVDWDSVEVDAELEIKVKLVACTYHCG